MVRGDIRVVDDQFVDVSLMQSFLSLKLYTHWPVASAAGDVWWYKSGLGFVDLRLLNFENFCFCAFYFCRIIISCIYGVLFLQLAVGTTLLEVCSCCLSQHYHFIITRFVRQA
jgi:hypothetical protein